MGHTSNSLEDVEHRLVRRLFNWFHFTLEGIYGEVWITEVNNKDKTKEMLKLSIVKTKHTGLGMGYKGRKKGGKNMNLEKINVSPFI